MEMPRNVPNKANKAEAKPSQATSTTAEVSSKLPPPPTANGRTGAPLREVSNNYSREDRLQDLTLGAQDAQGILDAFGYTYDASSFAAYACEHLDESQPIVLALLRQGDAYGRDTEAQLNRVWGLWHRVGATSDALYARLINLQNAELEASQASVALPPPPAKRAPSKNTNVLEGLSCPNCASDGPFKIAAKVWATVYDNGVEDTEDHQWDDDSACICKECNYEGNILNFDVEGREEVDKELSDPLHPTTFFSGRSRPQTNSASPSKRP